MRWSSAHRSSRAALTGHNTRSSVGLALTRSDIRELVRRARASTKAGARFHRRNVRVGLPDADVYAGLLCVDVAARPYGLNVSEHRLVSDTGVCGAGRRPARAMRLEPKPRIFNAAVPSRMPTRGARASPSICRCVRTGMPGYCTCRTVTASARDVGHEASKAHAGPRCKHDTAREDDPASHRLSAACASADTAARPESQPISAPLRTSAHMRCTSASIARSRCMKPTTSRTRVNAALTDVPARNSPASVSACISAPTSCWNCA
jgi:hypothetical protein